MEIFKIGNNYLDEYQKEVVLDNSKALLVVAGAGSGKTMTILAKVKYLIEIKKIKSSEILLLSLTNETVNNLKEKLKNMGYKDLEVYTFHKLGLNILRSWINTINIVSEDYLNFIVDEYMLSYIFNNKQNRKRMIRYFRLNVFKDINSSKEYVEFKSMIISIIHLIKNNNFDINYVFNIYEKSIFDKSVWKIILDILIIYKRELDSLGLIDFDDMINEAYKLIKENNISFNYKYIIIDEFQDISVARYKLVKEVLDRSNAKFIAVGDDWQSIYGFTGCSVDILINFNKYFEDSNILYLKNTYRNSTELIYVASNFILKNNFQIKKELFSSKHIDKPIKIVYSNDKNILENLLKLINKDNVMILGRNNYDIKNHTVNNYRYLTIHKSKGLEADEVILINLENKIDGFPNKKGTDKFKRKLLKNKEKYKYAEERRLFYVALTRTKNSIYLVLRKDNKSIFVSELINDFKDYIEYIKIKFFLFKIYYL